MNSLLPCPMSTDVSMAQARWPSTPRWYLDGARGQSMPSCGSRRKVRYCAWSPRIDPDCSLSSPMRCSRKAWPLSARAFCRAVSKEQDEAVDFLELRAPGGPDGVAAQLDAEGLRAFAQSLSELVVDDLARRSSPNAVAASRAEVRPTTRVYFERQSLVDGCYLLVVDAPDSDGLLHAVSSALHENGMRIVACEIRTVGDRARDRFEVEPSPQRVLNDGELCDVQLAVLAALPAR